MRSDEQATARDTVFSLPSIEDPPSTETGVILMGLDVRHLLIGLGLAALADDPASVTLLADQVRHRGTVSLDADQLLRSGARRWQVARPALDARVNFEPVLRPAWAQAFSLVSAGEVGPCGPATVVYLAACCLRRTEVERFLRQQDGPAEA